MIDPNSCPGETGLFVSTNTGADTNPGTKQKPFKTIGKGIAAAKALGGMQVVFVAQGSYAEKVTLAEGVRVNGGYGCSTSACTWARDLVAFESTIANTDFEGVLAGAGITPATVLNGFRIVGKDGQPPAAPGSVALTAAGGAPTLRGLEVLGGNVTGGAVPNADRSIGIALRGTGGMTAVIENNEIAGGAGIGLSAGITLEIVSNMSSLATINANFVRGGTARRSDAIAAFGGGTTTKIVNNDITAGSSQNGASNGIEAAGTVLITNNRINVDTAAVGTCAQSTTWCSGIASVSGTLTISNNVVYGPKGLRTAAVLMSEMEIPAGKVVLNGNYLNGGGIGGNSSGVGRHESAAVALMIGQCTTCGLTGVVGRIRNNIMDGGINLNRYGVREDPAPNKTIQVEILQANDIWFAAQLPGRNDVLYREVSSFGTPIDTKSVIILNQSTDPPCSANLNADPDISASWHLQLGSPCVDTGVATEAPAEDFEAESRPSGQAVDIGPDEKH